MRPHTRVTLSEDGKAGAPAYRRNAYGSVVRSDQHLVWVLWDRTKRPQLHMSRDVQVVKYDPLLVATADALRAGRQGEGDAAEQDALVGDLLNMILGPEA